MAGFGEPGVTEVDAAGMTVGVVAARWHGELTDHMLDRAVAAAKACGADTVVARVAGSVELPVVAQALARRCDVVVALGVVIRGETAHFDYVCRSVTDGLTRIALDDRQAGGARGADGQHHRPGPRPGRVRRFGGGQGLGGDGGRARRRADDPRPGLRRRPVPAVGMR